MAEPTITYQDCIFEAFIDPIRSVTVIDDDFPTLKTLLTGEDSSKQSDKDRLQNIIEFCQAPRNSWSLDVYDGTNPALGAKDEEIPSYLNHSDFLILDYHLDDGDNGERARRILRELSQNGHFNLVVVNTKGYDGDIKQVFVEILQEFVIKPNIELPDGLGDIVSVCDVLNEWLDDNEDGGIPGRLKEPLDPLKLLEYVDKGTIITGARNPNNPISTLQGDVDELLVELDNLKTEHVNHWIVSQQLDSFFSNTGGSLGNLQGWGYQDQSDQNWLLAGNIFVTVARKEGEGLGNEEGKGLESEAGKLSDILKNALVQYNPPPLLLLMAKMRHELDESGFKEFITINNDKAAQAGWTFQLLEEPSSTSDKMIELHWSLISDKTKESLKKFAQKTVQALQPSSKKLVKDFFGGGVINDHIDSLSRMNAYLCSKAVTKQQLSTGHILEIDGEYWVSLSPACDMIHGQRKKGIYCSGGEQYLPFQAVQLTKAGSISTAISSVNDNNYIFIERDGEIIAFSYPPSKDNPVWEIMYADNKGSIGSDGKVLLHRLISEKGMPKVSGVLKCSVISELRYEYALNFLQKFGGNQSRVGLGFVDKLWNG